MYLFEYLDGEYGPRNAMEFLASKHKVDVEHHHHTSDITSAITVTDPETHSDCVIHEFPGNCSALILLNIQPIFEYSKGRSSSFNRFLSFSIDLCKAYQYGALFISGTSIEMCKHLEKCGFETIVLRLYNPHSGQNNFYSIKKFFQDGETFEEFPSYDSRWYDGDEDDD